MRSSGFGLGKSKKPQEEATKKQPPTNADLTQLLGMSQKSPDRTFHYNWHSPDQTKMYYLNVITHGKADQRKGWAVSAHDNAAVGAADWTLQADIEGRRQQLFNMQSSDSYMVQSVIDEILVDGQAGGSPAAAPLDEQWADKNVRPSEHEASGGPPAYGGAAAASVSSYGGAAAAQAPSYGGAAGGSPAPSYGGAPADSYGGAAASTYGGAAESSHGGSAGGGSYGGASAQSSGTGGGAGSLESGSLSVTPIRTLFQQFVSSGSTGRLLIEQGTVESEVFFTNGEPVHAKSVHSIYRDRDMTGDSVVVDLLTWTAGNYKFQNGYPAATRTVHASADDLLAGKVAVAPPASAAAAAAPAQASAPAKLPGNSAPPIPLAAKIKVDPDDFSNADDLIGETFTNLIEPSGMLKYGMFLMLTRTEFARHEMSRTPFCVAAIGLEGQGVLSYESIGRVQECFESAGQALDTISAATGVRFFALFPHCSGTTAAATLKQFLTNLQNVQLGNGIHGSALRMSVGLCEVPRDGADFETVMNRACKLRLSATPERRIVLNAG